MTFLPIVERELRVAARRKGTYLTRVGVGLGAMIVGGITGLVTLFNPTVRFGTLFFQTLAGLAMLYCLGAGRFLTADCLSAEKREETMGLLFLTDLKGYDVVLGKMAATSLNGLYGLLAVLPVLALTLLTGGITNAEFLRVALVLLDTFIFSLAIGIFASALTREFRAAMALNFYLLLLLAASLPAVMGLILYFEPAWHPSRQLLLSCPVYTLVLAFDVPYQHDPAQFWSSAGVILALSWLLVALSCKIAPQSWQVKPAQPARKTPANQDAFRARAVAFRTRLLDQNAYYWLAARPWWKAQTTWAVLGVALFWLIAMRVSVGWLDESICVMVAVTVTAALKFWITLEAGQTLAEDVKSGAFELLLATPLAARDIVRGQALALRRQFLKPLLVMTMFDLFFMGTLMAAPSHMRSLSGAYYFCFWMAGILMMAADAATLSLVAMAAGLTEKNLTRALLKTVRLVLVLPWAVWAAVMAAERTWEFLFSDSGHIGWGFDLGCWFGIGIVLDLLFGWTAWRRLTENFRELALQRFAEAPPRIGLRANWRRMCRAIRDNLWKHPQHRKWAMGFAALLLTGLLLEAWDSARSHDPPPENAWVGTLKGPLQAIAAGEGVFLILPDGSLWRWGKTELEGTNRFLLPEQVGTNRDWSTISVNGNERFGVRRDGTLWEWREDGVISRVGTNHDWAEATGMEIYKLARQKDGTLWAWGDVAMSKLPLSSPPVWIPAPPATNHDWKTFSRPGIASRPPPRPIPIPAPTPVSPIGPIPPASRTRADPRGSILAVDSDGTLWVWGTLRVTVGTTNSIYIYSDPIQVCRETNWVGFVAGMPQDSQSNVWRLFAAPPNPAESINTIGGIFRAQTPVQVGTNRDWTAIESRVNLMLATRSDGTLWGWGGMPTLGPLRYSMYLPTQICSETNWTGFDRTFGLLLARNSNGQFWLPISGNNSVAVPSPTTSISITGRLFASLASSSQPSGPFNPLREGLRYEVHADGTLWASPTEFTGLAGSRTIRPAQRADQRTDWVAVAATGHATFGLTADGTLWTWGWNLGEKPRVETRSRIAAATSQAQAAFAAGPPGARPAGAMPTFRFQEKPRALMKLVPDQR